MKVAFNRYSLEDVDCAVAVDIHENMYMITKLASSHVSPELPFIIYLAHFLQSP